MKKYISIVLIYCLTLVAVSNVSGQTNALNKQSSLKKVFSDLQVERANVLLGKKPISVDFSKLNDRTKSAQNSKSEWLNKKLAVAIGVGIAAVIVIVLVSKNKKAEDTGIPPCNPAPAPCL
jgi:hypothetical protein